MTTLPLIDGAFFVSSSFLETLSRCAREAEYYKLRNRVSAQASAGLTFGKHLHTAFEMHYRQQEFGTDPGEILQKVCTLLQREFELNPIDEDNFRNLNWACEIYRRCADRWNFENFTLMRYKETQRCKQCQGSGNCLDMDKQVVHECPWCNTTGSQRIMCEVPFAVKLFDLGSVPVIYHGFIDLPVVNGIQNFVLDFKTTLMLGDGFFNMLKMSAQQKGYCWAFQELTQIPIAGHIVRGIRTAQPPVWMQNGGTNKKGEYKKIDDWWTESLPEETFLLGEGELDEWKETAIDMVERFVWHFDRNLFPKETVNCIHKYGRCQYFEVCSTFPVKDREMLINSGLFKDKEPAKIME